MKKALSILILSVLTLSLTAQQSFGKHQIGYQIGYDNMTGQHGIAMNLQYTCNINDFFGVVASLSSYNGYKAISAHAWPSYYLNALGVGVTAHEDLGSHVYLRATGIVGMSFGAYNKILPNGSEYSEAWFPVRLGVQGEVGWHLSPRIDIGLFYSHAWMRYNNQSNAIGLTMQFGI